MGIFLRRDHVVDVLTYVLTYSLSYASDIPNEADSAGLDAPSSCEYEWPSVHPPPSDISPSEF